MTTSVLYPVDAMGRPCKVVRYGGPMEGVETLERQPAKVQRPGGEVAQYDDEEEEGGDEDEKIQMILHGAEILQDLIEGLSPEGLEMLQSQMAGGAGGQKPDALAKMSAMPAGGFSDGGEGVISGSKHTSKLYTVTSKPLADWFVTSFREALAKLRSGRKRYQPGNSTIVKSRPSVVNPTALSYSASATVAKMAMDKGCDFDTAKALYMKGKRPDELKEAALAVLDDSDSAAISRLCLAKGLSWEEGKVAYAKGEQPPAARAAKMAYTPVPASAKYTKASDDVSRRIAAHCLTHGVSWKVGKLAVCG